MVLPIFTVDFRPVKNFRRYETTITSLTPNILLEGDKVGVTEI